MNIRIGPYPLTIGLQSTGAGAGGGAAAALPFALPANRGGLIGTGRNSANFTVQGVENPFGQELARISALMATDPEQARQGFAAALQWYNDNIERSLRIGGTSGKTAKQSLANPKLWNTVNALAGQLGFTATTGSQDAGVAMRSLHELLLALQQGAGKIRLPGTINTGPDDDDDGIDEPITSPPPTTGPSGGVTDPPPTLPPGSPGGPPIPPVVAPPGSAPSSLLDRIKKILLPGEDLGSLIPLGLNIFGDIFGAKKEAEAYERGAKIMSDSADKALAQDKAIYDQNRADLEPWRKSGTGAVNAVSARMGLPGYEEFAPPDSYSLRQTGMLQPSQQRYPLVPLQRPLAPTVGQTGMQPPPIPDLNALADRYKRRAV